MSARNLCTSAYLNNVRRQEHEVSIRSSQETEEPNMKNASSKTSDASNLTSMKHHGGKRSSVQSEGAQASEEVSTVAAGSDASSSWSLSISDVGTKSASTERTRPLDDSVCWLDIRLGHRLQHYQKYAHCVDDIHVLDVFLELAGVEDVNGDGVKVLLRALKMMHLCDYSAEDICSTLAHASYYFLETSTMCGKRMDLSECGNILACHMFIAHVYVQDETCPLRVWHQHLFNKYCSLKTLNSAIMRILDLRDHRLRLPDSELSSRYTRLAKASRYTWNARLNTAWQHCIFDEEFPEQEA